MKHRIKHNQLGRNTNQAKALYRGLISALLTKGRIETSRAKAKAVQGAIDRIINLGKKNDVNSRRIVGRTLGSDQLTGTIFSAASQMNGRTSGYTRIIKIGPRFSDSAEQVYLELVERPSVVVPLAESPDKETQTKVKEKPAKETKRDKSLRPVAKSAKSVKKTSKS